MDLEKFISFTKIFIRIKRYDSACVLLSKAKNLYQERKIVSCCDKGIILKYSGDLQSVSGKYIEALKDYQSAIMSLDPSFNDTSIAGNPTSFPDFRTLFSFLKPWFPRHRCSACWIHSRKVEILYYPYKRMVRLYHWPGISKRHFSDDARLF